MAAGKRNALIAVTIILGCAALIAAGVLLFEPHDKTTTSHGMSTASWIAILFAGVWIPIFASGARRRRLKDAEEARRKADAAESKTDNEKDPS